MYVLSLWLVDGILKALIRSGDFIRRGSTSKKLSKKSPSTKLKRDFLHPPLNKEKIQKNKSCTT